MLDQIIKSLEDSQAIDISILDVRKQTSITDYMIVVSGRASRHVKAIAQKLIEDMKKSGLIAISATGLDNGEWALVDFGDQIVHIMLPDARHYYNLEGLWSEPS